MSVAFIFGPNAPMIDFDGTIHFYEGNVAMRRAFDQAAQVTGVDVVVLLRKRDLTGELNAMRVNSVALAAAAHGITGALAGIGVTPSVVGGISLGDMVSPAAAGAVAWSDTISMLYSSRHEPASSAPEDEEAIAFAYVPSGVDLSEYYYPQTEGVWFGAALGNVRWGDGQALMLSGYRSALEEFAAQHGEGNVRVRDRRVCSAAYHTRLRLPARAQLERILDGMHVADPEIPMCTSVLDQPVTKAPEVRELLLRNCVEAAWVSKVIAQIEIFAPRLVVTIGPAMAKGMFVFPVPVLHVDSLETMADAADAISEGEDIRLAA